MLVYKFGGSVIHDPAGIREMTGIIRRSSAPGNGGLFIVVSAFGKMTNAFESLWTGWIHRRKNLNSKWNKIKRYHLDIAGPLLNDTTLVDDTLSPLFNEVENIIKSSPPHNKDEAYDMIVPFGEILSTTLISAFFKLSGLDHIWLDARQLICTDSRFREAGLKWHETSLKINERLRLDKQPEGGGPVRAGIWLSQGFIGSDQAGRNTTLGREGSDFSAAVFAYVLNAEKLVIWKDVPGIMTGDPAVFPGASKLDHISYLDAIELSYFGAKVLHPNTIKPLRNKSIPLIVKSMIMPEEEGTMISDEPETRNEKPVMILKSGQVLLSVQPRDFSFVMEEVVSLVFAVLARNRVRVNLLQHGAVSMSFCIDYDEERLNGLIGELIQDFKVLYNTGLDLLTVRHYSPEVIDNLTRGKKIYIQQQSRKTARFVFS